MANKNTTKLTANFGRNLEAIATFLEEADALPAYDALLGELLDTVIPNLERFAELGRLFQAHAVRSVEVSTALERLQTKLQGGELREFLFLDYWLLYVRVDSVIYLLSIKHHRQLSFDFEHLWAVGK